MPTRHDRLTLVAFSDPNLFHGGDPAATLVRDRFDIGAFVAHAKLAEDAGFDAVFKPDFLGLDPLTGTVRPRAGFEPLTLMAALSQHTRRLGLIITESTSYTEPFYVARSLTSLDHLSAGRAGWNVVTSYYGEENFAEGKLLPLAERYGKADEYMRVAARLWDGWKEGAVTYGEGGHRVDGGLIERTDFSGTYFSVRQPLDVPPGPQRRPVIVQAGASEEGLEFAARHAEIVFAATPDRETADTFYRDLKERVMRNGRDPSRLKILPGLNIFTAATRAEAEAIHASQFTDQALLKYRDKLVREAPLFRLEELDLDEPIPASAIPLEEELNRVERRRSRGLLLRRYLDRPGTTLRAVLSAIYEFGHLTLIGTPDEVAADMAAWFEGQACDGFVLKGGNSFREIAQKVLPRLEHRKLLRRTARDDLTFRQAVFGPEAARHS